MTTTPNIGIYIPYPGQDLYGSSFLTGMQNIDAHDHSGAPNKGLPIGGSGIADGAVGPKQLNTDVVDTSTGIQTSASVPNQLQLYGILPAIFQLGVAASSGLMAMNGTNAYAVTPTGTTNQIAVSAPPYSNVSPPVWSLSPIVVNATQPAFSAGAVAQNTVAGGATPYTVQFTTVFTNQGSAFDGTSTFTAPVTGVYLFSSTLELSGITGNTTPTSMQFVTSLPATYTVNKLNSFPVVSGTSFSMNGYQLIHLTAAQTVIVNLIVNMSATPINVLGGTFTGVLVC